MSYTPGEQAIARRTFRVAGILLYISDYVYFRFRGFGPGPGFGDPDGVCGQSGSREKSYSREDSPVEDPPREAEAPGALSLREKENYYRLAFPEVIYLAAHGRGRDESARRPQVRAGSEKKLGIK